MFFNSYKNEDEQNQKPAETENDELTSAEELEGVAGGAIYMFMPTDQMPTDQHQAHGAGGGGGAGIVTDNSFSWGMRKAGGQ